MLGPNDPTATPQAPATGDPKGDPNAPAAPAAPVAPTQPAAPANPAAPAAPAEPVVPAEPGTPAAAQQAADAAVLAAQQGEPWYKALPADQHEALKDFATPADAVAAIEAGKVHTLAKEVGDYNFTFDDPNVDQNAPELLSFKQHCLDTGISPEAAQKTLEYQSNLLTQANETARAAGEAQLRTDWGNNYDANITKSLVALSAIDKATGGTLAAKLKMNGGANDPDILKALNWVSEKIGEDSLGLGGPGGGGGGDGPITAEQAYANLYANTK